MSYAHTTTLLIIEDDDMIRESLADILVLNNFMVLQAPDGTAGLALAKSEHPALIITDVSMPGISGFEVLRQVRGDIALRTTPVIIVSAKVDRTDLRYGMELGAADYITKPFTEDEVISAVRTQLEKKALLDELDAFAHTVAHDLKNPIATLSLRLGLLAMMQASTDEQSRAYSIAEAQRAADRLNHIVDNLLILSGVRRLKVTTQALDMAAIVAEALASIDALLQQHKTVVGLPPRWPPACGHPPWVVHIWVNYLSNAVRHAGAGGRVTLGGEVSPGGTGTRFWVQDYGPGLAAAVQEELFIPFGLITTVSARRQGLGLSIVQRVVEKLGGRAGVESAPGDGARFWFELPMNSNPGPAP
jgi:two-component system sensor histidine kinase/response regulator